MSEILTLASEFIERMANPAYGTAVNEEYSLRFAELLSRDRLPGLLREEAQRVTDVNALGGHGWLWFLNWARANDLRLHETLLLDLADRWSSVFMQVLIIDVATRGIALPSWPVTDLEEFPNEWLRGLLRLAVRQEERETPERDNRFEDEANREQPARTARAETTLISLMQVGRPVTVEAAAALLHHPWIGHDQLVRFYFSRLTTMDAETRREWGRQLRMEDGRRA